MIKLIKTPEWFKAGLRDLISKGYLPKEYSPDPIPGAAAKSNAQDILDKAFNDGQFMQIYCPETGEFLGTINISSFL